VKLYRLIKIASSAYPDNLMLSWHDGNDDMKDVLAQYLTHELERTWDEHTSTRKQLKTAIHVLKLIEHEVHSVGMRLAKELKNHGPNDSSK
jgi:hypothetical protein